MRCSWHCLGESENLPQRVEEEKVEYMRKPVDNTVRSCQPLLIKSAKIVLYETRLTGFDNFTAIADSAWFMLAFGRDFMNRSSALERS